MPQNFAPTAKVAGDPLELLTSINPEDAPDTAPVTILVARKIKAGQEANFEAALTDLQRILQSHDGFQELKAYHPGTPDDEHKVVLFFQNAAALAAWQSCAARKAWLERVKPLEDAAPRAQIHTGLTGWSATSKQEGLTAPPPLKMALVTWMGVFPIILVVNYFVAPHLKSLPIWLSSALTSGILVVLMNKAVLPFMTQLMTGFLYPEIKLAGKK